VSTYLYINHEKLLIITHLDNLLDIIDTKAMTARTWAIDISFGEILSLTPDELEIKAIY